MTEHRIDVLDIDTNWFKDVLVYVDGDRFLFPSESISRVAEYDPEDGLYRMPGEAVEAEEDEVVVAGVPTRVWAVDAALITTRPASTNRKPK